MAHGEVMTHENRQGKYHERYGTEEIKWKQPISCTGIDSFS